MNTAFQFSSSNLRHQTRLACGLIPLLNMLSDRGVEADEVLSVARIRKFELIDPAFTISLDQELAIVDRALDYFDEPAASLRLASYYHLHNFSVLGLALRACANLSEIFELIIRYPRLVWGVCETSGHHDGELLTFELKAGASRVERFLLERDMASIKVLVGEALQGELQLVRVSFAHEPPEDEKAYEAFFRCPVRFGASNSALSFPLSELERSVPTADPLSREFYEAQCARLSAEMDEPFRYSSLVRDHLLCTTPVPNLEALAQRLTIDPRTLQRYLKKEGQTFSHLLQEVRLRRATERLRYSSLSVEDIAVELGFSDPVAFSHAFKQWTGQSPREWRQSQLSVTG